MIRTIVVDDSALIRQMLTEMLNDAPDIEVVDTAHDPYDAREKIKAHNPDVITLDVEMPKMDGITFLRNIMRLRPMPVLMVSSLTQDGADVTLEALDIGAVDYVAKPQVNVASEFQDYAREIQDKIRMAASARVKGGSRPAGEKHSAGAILPKRRPGDLKSTERLIALGASTGGTEALRHVLEQLPPDSPGVVITQHIPQEFSRAFANRMDGTCAVTVTEAQHGQRIIPGHVYVAPGNRHLTVKRDGARYTCQLHDGDPVNRHRPSVDVLFRSVANEAGKNAVAALLTGMGDDGARGMKELHDLGAYTVAQNEDTSVVWGMPGTAVEMEAVSDTLALDRIAEALLNRARQST